MTNKTLNNQIRKLNSGNYHNSIFLRPLTTNVDVSITWTEPSDSNLNNGSGYNIYYIKNKEEYVGAIVDMGAADLHWFIVPEHRKKGYLTKAMKESILPHLFLDREEQRVTFNSVDSEEDSKASYRTAILTGFKKEGEDYIIRKSNTNIMVDFISFEPKLPKERYEILKKRLKTIRNEVGLIYEELYMLTGDDAGSEELKYKVNSVIMGLEDLNYNINGD